MADPTLIHTINPEGSTHTITILSNDEGGFTVRGNNYRVVEFKFGGGEFHIHLPGQVPNSDTCGFNVTDEHATVVTE